MADQPRRLCPGDFNPLTPTELLDAGMPVGTLPTAAAVNEILDRMRAESPTGELPAHVQARIDAGVPAPGWVHRHHGPPQTTAARDE